MLPLIHQPFNAALPWSRLRNVKKSVSKYMHVSLSDVYLEVVVLVTFLNLANVLWFLYIVLCLHPKKKSFFKYILVRQSAFLGYYHFNFLTSLLVTLLRHFFFWFLPIYSVSFQVVFWSRFNLFTHSITLYLYNNFATYWYSFDVISFITYSKHYISELKNK